MIDHKPHPGLRAIALFKASKSISALLGALWLSRVVGQDVHAMAVSAAAHLHMDPDWSVTRYLVTRAGYITDSNIWFVIWTLGFYALVHGAEAYGLWHELVWAEWFTLSSGAIYIPIELHSMIQRVTWINISALLISFAITGYVGWLLYHSRKRRRETAGTA